MPVREGGRFTVKDGKHIRERTAADVTAAETTAPAETQPGESLAAPEAAQDREQPVDPAAARSKSKRT